MLTVTKTDVRMRDSGSIAVSIRPLVLPLAEGKAREIANRAWANAPYRTGRLKASIRVDRRDAAGRFTSAGGVAICAFEVSANTPYAGFVEFGTRKMRARPYLRPALRQAGV